MDSYFFDLLNLTLILFSVAIIIIFEGVLARVALHRNSAPVRGLKLNGLLFGSDKNVPAFESARKSAALAAICETAAFRGFFFFFLEPTIDDEGQSSA